jgi:hypothetical protein
LTKHGPFFCGLRRKTEERLFFNLNDFPVFAYNLADDQERAVFINGALFCLAG